MIGRPWTYLALTVSVMSFRSQSTWFYQHQSSEDCVTPSVNRICSFFLFVCFYFIGAAALMHNLSERNVGCHCGTITSYRM